MSSSGFVAAFPFSKPVEVSHGQRLALDGPGGSTVRVAGHGAHEAVGNVSAWSKKAMY